MVVALIVLGILVVAAIVAYKLHKSGKAVTGASVLAGVEADAKTVATKAEKAVANTIIG